MHRLLILALALVLNAALRINASAEPLGVAIAYQPGTFGGLPLVVAGRLDLWRQAELAPVLVSFPAPTPFLMAAGVRGWDIGAASPGAAIIGAGRFGLQSVALTSEEGGATVLLAPPPLASRLRDASARIDGWKLLVTHGSAAGLVARSCLRWLGLGATAARPVELLPPAILERYPGEQAALAALTAPQSLQLMATGTAAPVCSGRDAGVTLPGFLVVRPTFAREQPETVRRVVAVYLRALAWIAARPAELPALARRYYADAGIDLSDAAIADDLTARSIYDAAAQRRLFDRSAGAATVDRWVDGLATWLAFTGTVDVPASRNFITGAFLPDDGPQPPAIEDGRRDQRARVR